MSDDGPFFDVIKTANERIQQGWTIYQKFTCGECGQRLTMDVPNTFYEQGTCDKCGFTTNIRLSGCNFMATYEASHGHG